MTSIPQVELLAPDALARGLLTRDERLEGLVTHSPADPDAPAASARVAAARRIDRDALAAALLGGLVDLEAPPAAMAAAERLRDDGVVAVVSGQQPVLLGGGAMVLVKALAAAATANALSARGVPAVPVFWLATEDHDHAEADHVGWPSRGEIERLRLPLPGDGRMLARVPVPAEAAALGRRVLAELSPGPGREALAGVLLPRDGESFGRWTGRLLARVLGAQGIAVVEPRSLRALGAAVVEHELRRPGELRQTVAAAVGRASQAGFAPPLLLRRDALYFEVDAAGHRSPPGDPPRSDGPGEWFSWNVAGRVLAQDLALPVAAHVCGPAELGYVGLLREAHALLGVPQPLATLRPGLTIVEPSVRRACDGLGVTPAAVVRRGPDGIPRPPLAAAADLAGLSAAIAALPAGSSPAAKRRRAALEREAGLLEEALRRDAEQADAVRVRRSSLVLRELRPGGRPQERVLSFLPWYAAGGDAVVARLRELLGTGEPVHHVLRTEDL